MAGPQQADEVLEVGLLAAVVLGIVEGLTEFLPVSSTGHLIVAGKLLGVHNSTLEVGIQVGAITAILVLYGSRLVDALRRFLARDRSQPNLLLQLVLAALPAALLGLLLDDWLDAHLFDPAVVATTTVVGGLLLWWLEAWLKGRTQPALELHQLSYRTALLVGCFQCLALIPGTSRSGATIAGALLLGASRGAAAELSFLVGLRSSTGPAASSSRRTSMRCAARCWSRSSWRPRCRSLPRWSWSSRSWPSCAATRSCRSRSTASSSGSCSGCSASTARSDPPRDQVFSAGPTLR